MIAPPVSVIITTKNESSRIDKCLSALMGFDEILVVDSGSTDGTQDIVFRRGATLVPYIWNGLYPKKRQWCLDHLKLKNDWIFFVDADEIITEKLFREIQCLFQKGMPPCDGYFVRGHYVLNGRTQRFGLSNSKLALFDRRRFEYPVVNDLDLPGMGEMEGHYQPIVLPGQRGKIGRLKSWLLHEAYDGPEEWLVRHRRYAEWETGMNMRNAWPADPMRRRQALKRIFRAMPGRAYAAFFHSYILKLGFLDGAAGMRLAIDRYRYYCLIRQCHDFLLNSGK